jgi:hypothetical protein
LATEDPVVIDDRLLIEELLAGLPEGGAHVRLNTTTYWYYRACRAAVVGAGGQLSGPFQELAVAEQERAILSLLALREDIGLPDPRTTVPAMVDVAHRHPRLNLLNLEAVAVAGLLAGTVWLSEQASEGILPPVLEAERIAWRTVNISAGR